MKFSELERMRILAAATGIGLVVLSFFMAWLGWGDLEQVSMLVAAVAGFELFYFGQDISRRFRRKHG